MKYKIFIISSLFFLLIQGCLLYPYNAPVCYYNDECNPNTICDIGVCTEIFYPFLRVRETGEAITPCVLWNNSYTGRPVEMERYNPYCRSYWEIAVPCQQRRYWKRICM